MRTLSAAGVELVRSEVLDTGLFEQSAHVPLVLVPNAGAECVDGLGLTFATSIDVATDAGSVTVSWNHSGAPESCHVPSDARVRLTALMARLEALSEWLPADAWADATARPYEAERYRILTITQPGQDGLAQLPGTADVVWPLAGSMTTYGDTLPPHPSRPDQIVRCGTLGADEAASVVAALAAAGAAMTDSTPPGFASATLMADSSSERSVALVLEALPPGDIGCEDVDLGFLNCWTVSGVDAFSCAVP